MLISKTDQNSKILGILLLSATASASPAFGEFGKTSICQVYQRNSGIKGSNPWIGTKIGEFETISAKPNTVGGYPVPKARYWNDKYPEHPFELEYDDHVLLELFQAGASEFLFRKVEKDHVEFVLSDIGRPKWRDQSAITIREIDIQLRGPDCRSLLIAKSEADLSRPTLRVDLYPAVLGAIIRMSRLDASEKLSKEITSSVAAQGPYQVCRVYFDAEDKSKNSATKAPNEVGTFMVFRSSSPELVAIYTPAIQGRPFPNPSWRLDPTDKVFFRLFGMQSKGMEPLPSVKDETILRPYAPYIKVTLDQITKPSSPASHRIMLESGATFLSARYRNKTLYRSLKVTLIGPGCEPLLVKNTEKDKLNSAILGAIVRMATAVNTGSIYGSEENRK